MTASPPRLGDICELINGGAWKQTEYMDDGIPVVQVSNMKNGTIDVSGLKFLPPTSYDRYEKHILKESDLVIATVGSHATQESAAGRATIVKEFAAGMLLNQNAVAIRSKSESLDQGYLGLIGRSKEFQFYLSTVGQGAANQVRIALSAIKEYKCDLPPYEIQRQIAEVISNYDELIENNRRRIQLLEQAARLLYKEWFVQFRFLGHEHVTMIDGVPEGWEMKQVKDVLGKVKRPRKIKTSEFLDEGPIPCVDQSRDFIGGYTNDEESIVDIGQPVIVFGDHTRILKFVDFPFACGADGTQLIVSNDEVISQEFLYFALDAIDLSNYFYARHFKFLKDQYIPRPPNMLLEVGWQ